MELGELVDMLSAETATYTHLLAERSRNEDFEQAKKMIKLLQAEIEYRLTEADTPGRKTKRDYYRGE